MNTDTTYFDSPLGMLEIMSEGDAIVSLLFKTSSSPAPSAPASAVIKACIAQLEDYFRGDRIVFDLPLQPKGTVFYNSVWKELQHIPYGETVSYIDIARRLGDEKSVRAVGTANGRNPIAIIIPCHRVIGASGKLVGYSGELWRKEWLLKHEAAFAPKKAGRLF